MCCALARLLQLHKGVMVIAFTRCDETREVFCRAFLGFALLDFFPYHSLYFLFFPFFFFLSFFSFLFFFDFSSTSERCVNSLARGRAINYNPVLCMQQNKYGRRKEKKGKRKRNK